MKKRCSLEPMVGAARDGRLDPREQRTIARHLTTCATCQALSRDLARIAELAARDAIAPKTALEQHRSRLLLVNRAVVPDATARPRFRRIAAVSGAAAPIAVIALLLHHHQRTAATPSTSTQLAPQATTLASTPSEAPSSAADTASIIDASAGAAFRSQRSGLERIELEDGTLDVDGRRGRLVVVTRDADVDARAASFRATARLGRLTRVAVAEGTVDVRAAGTTTRLGPGDTWAPRDEAEFPVNSPNPIRSVARLQGARATRAATSASASAPEPRSDGDAAGPFIEGMRLIEQRDYPRAIERLSAFREARPRDSRAEDAAYMIVVALQRSGRRDEARARAQLYLLEYPHGYRRSDVEPIAR